MINLCPFHVMSQGYQACKVMICSIPLILAPYFVSQVPPRYFFWPSLQRILKRLLQGPVSRKPRKLFGPAKPFLVTCILKTEKCIGLKLCMKETSVHIKNIMESDSSVIIRFAILLCLSGCENFSGPSRNGPQGTQLTITFN